MIVERFFNFEKHGLGWLQAFSRCCAGREPDRCRTYPKSSPATVGRRVAALERKLGTKLFDRRQSGYSLTEGGAAIRVKAEDMEDAIISAERETLGRDLRVTGRVRVTASDDIATYVIAPSLTQFRRLYPGIMLEIIARMDLINLSRSEADVALRGVRSTVG